MRRRHQYILYGVIYLAVISGISYWFGRGHMAIFAPAGSMARSEANLIYFTLALSLVIIIPVFVLFFTIAWKYREGNTAADYQPDWDHNRAYETVWWLVPSLLIVILAFITWSSSHALDPTQPLADNAHTMTIEVVSLDWKWLFIYPDQHIATVNYAVIPTGQAVRFALTSDAPMNSFWIPRLSGQIYTMPGMTTQLNIRSAQDGNFIGRSANISGQGFAGMQFTVKSLPQDAFNRWASDAVASNKVLNWQSYEALAKPSQYVPEATYGQVSSGLFSQVVAKYTGNSSMDGMSMGMGSMAMPMAGGGK